MPEQEEKLWHPVLQIEAQEHVPRQEMGQVQEQGLRLQEQVPELVHVQVHKLQEKNRLQ